LLKGVNCFGCRPASNELPDQNHNEIRGRNEVAAVAIPVVAFHPNNS